jgi:hypothetical protein
MPLFGSKPKLSIEKCCRWYYESTTNPNGNSWSEVMEFTFKNIEEADPSFSKVEKSTFGKEMKALRMEIFALEWFQKFKKAKYLEKYSYRQSIFTRQYLEERACPEIWDIMGEYNRAIYYSNAMNSEGEQFSEAADRAVVNGGNVKRLDLWKEWNYENPSKDKESPTVEEDHKARCIGRVLNRVGVSYTREDGIAHKLFVRTFLERLGCGTNLNSEATSRSAAVVFGFHKEAEDYLKSVDVVQ